MIRAKTLFSAISASLFISACSNGASPKKTPPQPARTPPPSNAQMMPPGASVVDPSLLAGNPAGNTQSTTVRSQSYGSQLTSSSVPVVPMGQAPLDEFGNPIPQPQMQPLPPPPPSPVAGGLIAPPITTTAPNNIPYYDPNYELKQSQAPVPVAVAPAPAVDAGPAQQIPAPVPSESQPPTAEPSAEVPAAPALPPTADTPSSQEQQQPTSANPPTNFFPAGPNDVSNISAPVAASAPAPIPPGLAQAPVLISTIAFTPTQTKNPDWTPGLPRAPYKNPILTFGHLPDGVAFTDGKFDSLMKGAWDILNADPDTLKTNIDFALQINNVMLSEATGGWFTLTLDIQEDAGKPAVQVVLQGNRIKDKLKKNQRAFGLKQIKVTKGDPQFKYHAHVLCADLDESSCESAQIELAKIDKKASGIVQPLAKSIIIHRISDAILYIDATHSKNANHEAFAHLIDNTKWNICRDELKTIKGEWHRTLKERCGKARTANSSRLSKAAKETALSLNAKRILIRTWAVAGGGAKYQIIFDSKDYDLYYQDALVISGDLVSLKDPETGRVIKSSEPARVVDRTKEGRQKWIKSIELVNNDGGGDLNFRVTFNATDKASPDEARFSVSSNLKPTIKPPDVKKSVLPAATAKDVKAPVAPDPKQQPAAESSAPISI